MSVLIPGLKLLHASINESLETGHHRMAQLRPPRWKPPFLLLLLLLLLPSVCAVTGFADGSMATGQGGNLSLAYDGNVTTAYVSDPVDGELSVQFTFENKSNDILCGRIEGTRSAGEAITVSCGIQSTETIGEFVETVSR